MSYSTYYGGVCLNVRENTVTHLFVSSIRRRSSCIKEVRGNAKLSSLDSAMTFVSVGWHLPILR